MEDNILYGRHPVKEALLAGTPIDKIYIKKGIQPDFFYKIKKMAAQAKIPFTPVEENVLERHCPGKNHQGIVAFASARKYDTVEDILKTADERGEKPFVLILNEVQDTNNLGSLLRSALGAGIHGVILPHRRSALLSPTVSKVSAGADAHIKVATVTNISNTIEDLKEKGLYIVGTDSEAETLYTNFDFSGPLALVLGGEDKGLGQRVKNSCDILLKIPLKGPVNSLNVGVSGAIFMFKAQEKR